MRRVTVGSISLAAAALSLAVRAQQDDGVVTVKLKPPSPYADDSAPKFFSVREPKSDTAPRSPRKSFKKSSKR